MARINVIYKPTGQAGTVDDSEFNPQIYQMSGASAPTPQPPAATPPPAAPVAQATPATSPAPIPQPQGDGLLAGIGKALVAPLIYAGKNLGGAGVETYRKASYLLGNKDAYDVQKGIQNPFETRDEAIAASAHPFQTGAKTAAALGSYAVPGGGGLAATVGHGAVQGALYGLAEGNGVDPKEIAKNAILAAGTGGALYGAGKLISGAGGKIAEKLNDSVFREPLKDTKAAVKVGETLGKQALDRGEVGTSQGLRNGAISKINDLEGALQQKLVNSNASIGKDEILKAVNPLVEEYNRAGNPTAAKAITDRIAAIEEANGGKIPVAAANDIKRSLYDEVSNAYGTQGAANTEGIKNIAKSIKEAIASKIPEVDQINKNLGYYGRLRDSMTDLIAKNDRNNVLGLGDIGVGGLGGLLGGGIPGAAAAIGAKKLAGSAIGKTAAAQVLNKTSQGLGNILSNPLTIGAGRLAAEGTANALGNQQPAGGASTDQINQSRQAAVQGLIQQGITDPNKLLNTLNYDNNGKLIGDFTLDEVKQLSQPTGLPNTPSLIPQAQAAGANTTQTNPTTPPPAGLPQTPPNLTRPVSGYTTDQLDRAYFSALKAGDASSANELKAMADQQRSIEKANLPAKADQINPHTVSGTGLLGSVANEILRPDGSINRAAVIDLYNPISGSPLKANIDSLISQIAQSQTTSGRLPTAEQMKEYRNEFIPKLNDTDAAIKQKLKNAQTLLENVRYTKPTLDLLDQQP